VDECHRTAFGSEEVHGVAEALVPRCPWGMPPLEPAVPACKVMALPIDEKSVGTKHECEITFCTAMLKKSKR